MTPTTMPMPAWLESAWLARYLDRQLGGDEAAWFEAYLLDKPELLTMVEADSYMRDALAAETAAAHPAVEADGVRVVTADANASIGANVSTHSSFPRTPASGSSPSIRFRPPAWLALAASLVIGLGVGWLGQRALVPVPQTENLIANPTRIVFDTLRGAPSVPEIERADSASPYVLVEVAVPLGAEYIALHMGEKQQAALSQSSDGFVSFLIARATIDAAATTTVRYTLNGREETREITLLQLKGEKK